ncbi:HTH-type transcriptional regulator AcrR [Streptomyces sp. YIM 130001]|uniref:TetR/AcrR family transcriptional regulator n=1 Tax=Streptomyces sp. YIM 130001 TaxID=2259644 RepID=UPI000E659EA8|nr:TetR/AcrR family transcriptional regulator [Streptomyces sp. YIM 130001]RII17074.1 HTH-type transcriptional regulator AcrR [Streptomyces sp. YIM 130001]
MTSDDAAQLGTGNARAAKGRPRGGVLAKRRAILDAALTVFARDGYTRAGIDTIARTAEVSTRTVYNHFQDKAELFETVIQESATRVAEAQIALLERHLSEVTDLEQDLVAFGTDWVSPTADYADHSALVRQINAEVQHIPATAIEAWQAAGPQRVQRELAFRFGELAARGLLDVPEPRRAARHFSALVAAGTPSLPGRACADETVRETVAAGVRAFLYGYASA